MWWRVLIFSLVALATAPTLRADTLIVAGRAQTTPAPFIAKQDEVLCPVTPSVHLPGAKLFQKGSLLSVVTPQRTIRMTLDATAATVNDDKITLRLAPCKTAGSVYLPVLSLAPQLDLDASYDEKRRTLTVCPILEVSHQVGKDGVAITVRSSLPLQYTQGTLDNPPRIYYDFKHAAFAATDPIPVETAPLQRLRLARFSPTTVRLVADLQAPVTPKVTLSDQQRQVTILINTTAEKQTPAAKKSAKLLSAELLARAGQTEELVVTASEPITATHVYQAPTRQLTITMPKLTNAIADKTITGLHSDLVRKVQVGTPVGENASRLTVTFTKEVPYRVTTTEKRLSIAIGTPMLRGLTIVLDPGHGGVKDNTRGIKGDPGACGPTVLEKDINLAVALRAAQLLKATGATVLLTRSDDIFIELADRTALANARNADLFISIHCNSNDRDSATGTETLYDTAQSATLAIAIQTALINTLGLPDRGAVVPPRNLWVLRATKMPAVLAELAFINNPKEEALLNAPAFQQKAATAIVDGICRYIADKSKTTTTPHE